MFKQGSDLRQFADAKVDALRAELATAVENEANLRNALALGNQRLAEQTDGLRGSLQNAEQVHLVLQSEYAICRDAFHHLAARLAQLLGKSLRRRRRRGARGEVAPSGCPARACIVVVAPGHGRLGGFRAEWDFV